MFNSLRNRLWLSSVLVTGVALCVMGIAFIWAIQRVPLFYRQAVLKLRSTAILLANRIDELPLDSSERMQQFILQEAEAQQVRIILYDLAGDNTIDSAEETESPVHLDVLEWQSSPEQQVDIPTFRDARRQLWLYDVMPVREDLYLLIAIPRPAFRLRMLFRDEISTAFVLAGLVGIVLAFLVSLIIATTVSSPLRRIASSAEKLAHGQYVPIQPQGPQEVRQLANTFNEMVLRLETGQKSQRDFIANVSHELKTPLTSIQGFAGAILDGTVHTPDSLREAAQTIFDETNRMYHLVMDLLTLTRLESKTEELHLTTVDLTQLLQSVSSRFALAIQNNHLELVMELEEGLCCQGDGERLAQVFSNLLDNAIKFSPPGMKIFLIGEKKKKDIEIRVRDMGIGIKPEDQERVFERFYQVEKSRKGGVGRGVGLGLAITRQIVLAHQGEISLDSQPGNGSTFLVKLPIEAPLSFSPPKMRPGG
jgi:signal transduction histidine kinase